MAKAQTEATPSAPVAPSVPDWIKAITPTDLAAAPVKGKKQRLCGRRFHYTDENGVVTYGSRAMPNSSQLDFCFADGEIVEVRLDAMPSEVIAGLQWRGLSENGQNAFAKTEGTTLGARCENAREALVGLVENMVAGIWVIEGEKAGPRIGQAVRAVVRALEADGQSVDAERIAAIADKLKADGAREAVRDDAIMGPHLIDIQDEDTAKARDKRRAALAESKEDSKLGDF